MPFPKPTAEAFLATVKKSGLVEQDRLQKALDAFRAAGGDLENSLALAECLVARNALSRWQAEKLLQGKHKGYFLGKYRLLSLLGKGGMSSVFLAEHILMRRRCAIKVLPTKRVADSSYLARFHREAQAVAALDHPNIVRAYDIDHQLDRDTEIHFLVMEYVEGRSLQELVATDGPCQLADAAEYIRQAALGLEHAHQAGMVHRDIKPGNLLVDVNGTVKLLDLGLARYFSAEGEETALTIAHDEKVLGTADYLAPEQALDSHAVDRRADIYSLGCTLYFLLTGHPPFTEGTLAQRLMAHQTKEPPPIELGRPDTPASLAAILKKMMAKHPEDRQASAQDVANDLLQWLISHATPAWKQAHPQLFGRSSDPEMNLPADAASVPVAKPVMLTLTTETEEADTEIIARSVGPKTSPAAKSTPMASEPNLSAFLAQVPPKSPKGSSSTKAAKSTSSVKSKSETKTTPNPPSSSEFDFLDSALGHNATNTAGNSNAAKQPASASGTAKVAGNSSAAKSSPRAKHDSTRSQSPAENMTYPSCESPSSQAPFVSSTPLEHPPEVTAAKPEASPPVDRPVAVYLAATAVGLALIAGLTAWLSGWIAPESDSGSAGTGVQKSAGNLSKAEIWAKRQIRVYGEDADYSSLTQALLDAQRFFEPKPGAKPDEVVIQVAAGTHEEQINIDGNQSDRMWPSGIVVRGEGEVVFGTEQAGPVLSLRDVRGLKIEHLTIDASHQPVGVLITSIVDDTTLSQITIQNFSETGMELSGILSIGKPLEIHQVRCQSTNPSAMGIRITPLAHDGKFEDSGNIAVTHSRFDGQLEAGVVIQGSTPHDISIRESIFQKVTTGIHFEGKGGWRNISIANNSFYGCGVGIDFASMPDISSSGLIIRRNLFSQSTIMDGRVQGGYQSAEFLKVFSSGGLNWNMSDRPKATTPSPNEINLFSDHGQQGVNFAFDSVNPKTPKFLSPSGNSPQRSAPNPIGQERDWVGAVGP